MASERKGRLLASFSKEETESTANTTPTDPETTTIAPSTIPIVAPTVPLSRGTRTSSNARLTSEAPTHEDIDNSDIPMASPAGPSAQANEPMKAPEASLAPSSTAENGILTAQPMTPSNSHDNLSATPLNAEGFTLPLTPSPELPAVPISNPRHWSELSDEERNEWYEGPFEMIDERYRPPRNLPPRTTLRYTGTEDFVPSQNSTRDVSLNVSKESSPSNNFSAPEKSVRRETHYRGYKQDWIEERKLKRERENEEERIQQEAERARQEAEAARQEEDRAQQEHQRVLRELDEDHLRFLDEFDEPTTEETDELTSESQAPTESLTALDQFLRATIIPEDTETPTTELNALLHHSLWNGARPLQGPIPRLLPQLPAYDDGFSDGRFVASHFAGNMQRGQNPAIRSPDFVDGDDADTLQAASPDVAEMGEEETAGAASPQVPKKTQEEETPRIVTPATKEQSQDEEFGDDDETDSIITNEYEEPMVNNRPHAREGLDDIPQQITEWRRGQENYETLHYYDPPNGESSAMADRRLTVRSQQLPAVEDRNLYPQNSRSGDSSSTAEQQNDQPERRLMSDTQPLPTDPAISAANHQSQNSTSDNPSSVISQRDEHNEVRKETSNAEANMHQTTPNSNSQVSTTPPRRSTPGSATSTPSSLNMGSFTAPFTGLANRPRPTNPNSISRTASSPRVFAPTRILQRPQPGEEAYSTPIPFELSHAFPQPPPTARAGATSRAPHPAPTAPLRTTPQINPQPTPAPQQMGMSYSSPQATAPANISTGSRVQRVEKWKKMNSGNWREG